MGWLLETSTPEIKALISGVFLFAGQILRSKPTTSCFLLSKIF
jgi:hypothetical protein